MTVHEDDSAQEPARPRNELSRVYMPRLSQQLGHHFPSLQLLPEHQGCNWQVLRTYLLGR